jgi:hypothetical protein
MNHRNRTARPAAALAFAVALLAATPAAAQQLISGFARSDQTDVTGVAVTSADLLGFEPGIVKTFTCPVAWGVRTAADSLHVTLAAPGAPTGAEADLLALLEADAGARQSGARLVAALSAGNDPAAARLAAGLVPRLRGLLQSARRMEPSEPGPIAATRLHASVAHFNRFVEAGSPAFLAAPPPEMVALRQTLGALVRAAEIHDGREADPAAPHAAASLACAPPPPPPPPTHLVRHEPPPPEMLRLCVVHEGSVRYVLAMRDPATREITFEGRAFAEAFPDVGQYAEARSFFLADEPVVLDERRYVRFGSPRVLEPEDVMHAGEFRGVPVFVEAGLTRAPDVVYLPTRAGCEFQPYQLEVKTGRVRG